MGINPAMSESERVHFKIALPLSLKTALEHHAVENRRSLSAEIIARLEASLSKPRTLADLAKYIAPPLPLDDPLDGIRSDIQELSKQIEALRDEGYDLGKPKKR